MSSVSSYDTKGLAESVAGALREQAKQELCIGVFYDPLEKWSFRDQSTSEPSEGESEVTEMPFQKIKRNAKDRSRAQLRRQVQDFIVWLEKNR